MIKAFFVDLDGTLLEKPKGMEPIIPTDNLDALKKLVASGIRVITASGRDLEFTKNRINGFYGFDFDAVASNGAIIYINGVIKENEVEYNIDRLKELSDFLYGEDEVAFCIVIKDRECRYAHINTLSYIKLKEITKHWSHGIDLDVDDFFLEGTDKEIYKVCVFSESAETTKKWAKILNKKFNEDFEIFSTDWFIIELSPKNINKGRGLNYICEYFGYSYDEVAAIGDAENDISMLEMTQHSYVMASADDDVKAHANQEVGSVAEAIYDVLRYNEDIS